MPSFTRMKIDFLKGLLWLILLQYGHMVLSLEPGFLDFDNLPDTNFTCVGKVIGGYYADLETNCQMFHVCTIGQADEPMDIRFLCLNGTVFDQETRVCERIDEVDCSKSERFYSLNLELYGNTGPILEETPEVPQETEPPSIQIKSTTTPTTTTGATTKKSASNAPYYTTARPATSISPQPQSQGVTGHHFPANPDIRFNPEEINISLNPGAPPDIRTNRFGILSDSNKHLVNNNNNNKHEDQRKSQASSTSKTIYAIDARDSVKLPQSSNSFDFDDAFASTSVPTQQQQFLIQTNSFRHSQSYPQNVNPDSQYHQPQFHSTTVKQLGEFNHDSSHTTSRTIYLSPHKFHQHHQFIHHPRTDKTPQRVQIPIPLVPTLPPLTFSSPAPFSLQSHVETKRYIKEHASPPRIIISASASVSDASGRRLNYSLGTIGAHNILETPPSSYDDYKDGDVVLDPFYHDVPKVKESKRRRKRRATKEINPFDIIKNEKEAVEVLKFLYTWYQSHQATATVPPVTSPKYASADVSGPVTPELIKEINELAPGENHSKVLLEGENDSSSLNYYNNNVSIINDQIYRNAHDSKIIEKMDNVEPTFLKETEVHGFDPNATVDDNYEPEVYVAQMNKENEKSQEYSKESVKEISKEAITHTKSMEMINNSSTEDAQSIKTYFDPNDYVDDNYEPIVYKEAEPQSDEKDNKVNDLNKLKLSKPEEDNNEAGIKETGRDENKKLSINKETEYVTNPVVSELYKYFNVKPSLTALKDTKESELDITTTMKSEPSDEKNDFVIKEEVNQVAVSDLYKYVNVNIQLLNEQSAVNNSTDLKGDLNGKSSLNNSAAEAEVSEEKQTSTSTTTTSTTTIAPRYTVKKRGRGRQRYLDSQQEASYKSDISKHHAGAHESKNYISDPTRVLKNRGRSRFSVAKKPTTTTTTLSPISISVPIVEVARLTTSTTTVAPTSISTSSVEVSKSNPTTTTDAPSSISEPNIEIAKSITTTTTGASISEPSIKISTSTIHSTDVQDSTELNSFHFNKLNKYAFLESQDSTEAEHLSSNNEPSITDSSYGAKLLRYFAQVALEESTDSSAVSYEPITEIERTTTPVSIHKVKNSKRNRHRHSNRVSTTELPTLRDIQDSTKSADDELLEKLSTIEQSLEQTTTSSTITDAPVEETESFGTTVLSITGPTIPRQYTTEEPLKTETFVTGTQSTTEPYKINFFDDVFIVPEHNSEVSSMDYSTAMKTDEETTTVEPTTETITSTPEVEIQKSISLPISVLQTSYHLPHDNNAQDINSLANNEINPFPTTLPETSTETTQFDQTIPHEVASTTDGIAETIPQTLLTTPAPLHDTTRLERPKQRPGMVNSSHLYQILVESTTNDDAVTSTTGTALPDTATSTASSFVTSTVSLYPTRRIRPTRRRPQVKGRNHFGRHRFSTELFTTKPPNITDTPLLRSASPTRADLKKISLITTPLSSKGNKGPTRVGKNYVFNCFGKEINKFYADPRDCRLFHYCTSGYSKNQLLDLKYVCDQKTFFDEDKLICTKIKPEKCL
ncbi:serine-rich adhesin for platelets-like [Anthonomus grandis grandis]|uniref:serine-rich adhesin for platelets-like n=1 Tax=Anthonomus grandis grandis TaxID=2921223 RepID=UPI002165BE5C|nr:serine-rich adhesin for platelets-like [Anthonomus grandis grandis]XP_050296115.1 serine-rich adhesin for platelets-like [Anthonomus grandis grandis]